MKPSSRAWFRAIITRADETRCLCQEHPNLRTNSGLDWQAQVMGSTTQPAAMTYLALTSDTAAPSATDTSLASEYTTNGLARAQGTYAHTTATNTFTIAKTFTCSANGQAINKEAMFNGASGGTMGFESAEPQAPTLNNGDVLTQTVQITF